MKKISKLPTHHANSDVTSVTNVHARDSNTYKETAGKRSDVTDVSVIAVVTEKERPCYRVYDCSTKNFRAGVYFHGMTVPKKKDAEAMPIDIWICSPLHIKAQTFDKNDSNYGRLLRFKNSNNQWKVWPMPMELLRGSGEELRGILLNMGLLIDPTEGKRYLLRYLQSVPPDKNIHCALQTGWYNQSFVLPNKVIGSDSDSIIFQNGENPSEDHGQAGEFTNWKEEISQRAIGNPILMFGLSSGFAGPLLQLCNSEGGGIHLVENSSSGKTTILAAACSIWGGSSFRRSWRATANGLEGAAALFNDNLLALDEISECEPKEVGKIVYSIANGYGKQRASKTGAAKAINRWRCFILSNGERTIETSMMEGGARAKAGQAVRLLDIPAKRTHGCWDDFKEFKNGAAFSDAIKSSTSKHYGLAGEAFLSCLSMMLEEEYDFCAALEEIKNSSLFSITDAQGQERRAIARFSLIALAGEIATKHGITGWQKGQATEAAALAFKAWKSLRNKGNDEQHKILFQLSDFIERHGDSRFSNITDEIASVRDRAGWWENKYHEGRVYFFNAAGMREALKGFDFKAALDALEECDIIEANSAGERAPTRKVQGRSLRLYKVNPDALEKKT
jgi:putative DNA primase/helicase